MKRKPKVGFLPLYVITYDESTPSMRAVVDRHVAEVAGRLERCGLEQPALFRAGMALGLRPLPRTMEEFETAAARMRGKGGENREEWV